MSPDLDPLRKVVPATAKPAADARPRKLIIQIPCLNEEESLPVTLRALPRGIDEVEVLVINDGSTDDTVATAKRLGVEHILDFKVNQGLAKTFMSGLREAARLGADYVVNLDADNQYDARDIPKLLEPLIAQRADMTVGERPISMVESFSPIKKILQHAGSWVVRRLSRTDVRDSPSGFRALNRKAMLTLFVFNEHTYTHESLIAARESDLKVVGVPIQVNREVLRPSRLMKSTLRYVGASAATILRFYLLYNPRLLLNGVGFVLLVAGSVLMVRFAAYYLIGEGQGHVQSVVVGGVLLTGAMLSFTASIFSDIIRVNRKLLQAILIELREQRYGPFRGDRDRGAEK